MSTGFGFCAKCGTPRIAADQKFCAGCGSVLAAMATPPQAASAAPIPSTPPPAPQPLAPQPLAQPAAPPPPPWAATNATQPVPPYAPAAYQAAPAPAAGAGLKITPPILAIGAVILVVIVGVVAYMAMAGSKPGSIAVSPSTISCNSGAAVTTTIKLPASLKADDMITIKTDGKVTGTAAVSELLKQQADGSWQVAEVQFSTEVCVGNDGPLLMGGHTMQILDAKGNVLAEGSMTLQP